MNESLLQVIAIVFVAIGIGFSIGWHELGHLIPAKLFGVKVPKYMIGFGPTIFSRKIGETEYGVKLIPLGGYISMIGMYPPAKPGTAIKRGFFHDMISSARGAHEEHVGPGDENRKFYQLAVWKRMIIMVGGPLMNLILGTILLTVVLSGFGVSRVSTTVAEVSPCVPIQVTAKCSSADAASPALAAGIESGDKITAINGTAITSWDDSASLIRAGVVNQISVVKKSGGTVTYAVTPVTANRPVLENGKVKLDDQGRPVMAPRPVLGVILASETRPLTIAESLSASGQSVAQVGQMLLRLPEQVASVGQSTFSNEQRDSNGPISVIGIGQMAVQVAGNGSVTLGEKLQWGLGVLASLNFALFAFNLLPLLPLDGGHVAGGIYEAIKKGIFRILRRPNPGPADTALLMPITWVMFIALMAMSALIIIADLVNPISV